MNGNLGILDSMKYGYFLSSWLAMGHLCSRKQDLSLCCAITHSVKWVAETSSFLTSWLSSKFLFRDFPLSGYPSPWPPFLYGPIFQTELKGSSKSALFTTSAGSNLPLESSQFLLCNSSNLITWFLLVYILGYIFGLYTGLLESCKLLVKAATIVTFCERT